MPIFADIMLIVFIPAVLGLYAFLPGRRAVLWGMVGGWLILPASRLKIVEGIPEINRVNAISYAVLLGVTIFEFRRWRALRLHWVDVPAAIGLIAPGVASLTNGLGPWDALSAVFAQTFQFGVPYLIGRLYFRDLRGLRELLVAVFVGALVYVPLCWFEIRMSPQLTHWVYGINNVTVEYLELGKWGSRPQVFMVNALALGMYLTAASLIGLWLWKSKSLTRIGGIKSGPLLAIVLVTTLAAKNVGATVLLLAGVAVLFPVAWVKKPVLVWMLVLAAPVYITVRTLAPGTGDGVVNIVDALNARRAESLETRLENENALIVKAMERPLFGWGRWGRSRIVDDDGEDRTITDGLWIITVGESGLVGLVGIMGMTIVPAIVGLRRAPARYWLHPMVAPIGAAAVLTLLVTIDNLFNAMLNPIFLAVAGGLAGMPKLTFVPAATPVPAAAAGHHLLGRKRIKRIPSRSDIHRPVPAATMPVLPAPPAAPPSPAVVDEPSVVDPCKRVSVSELIQEQDGRMFQSYTAPALPAVTAAPPTVPEGDTDEHPPIRP